MSQEWGEKLFQLAYDLLGLNGTVLHYLEQTYSKIRYGANDKEIKTKDIIDLIAYQRDDRKKVETALRSANLITDRDDVIPVEQWTEDQFFLFYRCLTLRTDVQKIFTEM